MITEIGGTVGDIEILPFLEAIRQFRKDVGRDNVFYVHVTLVPFIGPSGEQKTKPTQHSVTELRSRGIQPDAIVCRCDRPIPTRLKEKISQLCDVPEEGIVSAVDADDPLRDPARAPRRGPRRLRLPRAAPRRSASPTSPSGARSSTASRLADQTVRIGLVGKYVNLPDAYLSVVEALKHGGYACGAQVEIDWIAADDTEGLLAEGRLRDLDGIVIPGGFGFRGIEGKIAAAGFAREHGVPFLGLCLGLQCAVDRVRARRVRARRRELVASSTRTRPHPVIDLMDEQKRRRRHGRHDAARRLPGTPRGRARSCARPTAKRSSTSATATATRSTTATAQVLEEHGHGAARARSPDDRLVEFIELPRRDAPVLRRHPGAPRVQEPARPSAPAVRGVRGSGPSSAPKAGCPRLPIETESSAGALPRVTT